MIKNEQINAQLIENWLEKSLGKEVFNPGLERLVPFLTAPKELLQQKKVKIVTIAGTNGKGETAHFLAHLCKKQNISYALWTSPHLLSVTERFSSREGDIDLETLWDLLQNLKKEMDEQKSQLSYYEFLFVCFIRWVLLQKNEVLILEVGLGGRLDAVNFFSADVVLLTSIARDHMNILGSTLREILKEKLGVAREEKVLLSCLETSYLQDMTALFCQQKKVSYKDLYQEGLLKKGESFSVCNRTLALEGLSYLLQKQLPKENIQDPTFFSLGRGQEILYKDKTLFFYGSHNVDGVRKLIHFLHGQRYTDRKMKVDLAIVAFSMREEQEVRAILKILDKSRELFTEIIFTTFEHSKAMLLAPEVLDEFSFKYHADWKKVLHAETGKKNILITGSYYFVAEIQKQILANFK
ncbi:MAG: hypothetical protein KBD63_02730 [Bacteriovoracaceae bacterium]|nr:hypothetical protein [Bacteriovoracaceae bacterium]